MNKLDVFIDQRKSQLNNFVDDISLADFLVCSLEYFIQFRCYFFR